MGWKKEEHFARIYLEKQPLELQGLVTMCMLEAADPDSSIEVKKLFDKRKAKWIALYHPNFRENSA